MQNRSGVWHGVLLLVSPSTRPQAEGTEGSKVAGARGAQGRFDCRTLSQNGQGCVCWDCGGLVIFFLFSLLLVWLSSVELRVCVALLCARTLVWAVEKVGGFALFCETEWSFSPLHEEIRAFKPLWRLSISGGDYCCGPPLCSLYCVYSSAII